MKKVLGILGLLLAICLYTAINSDQFLSVGNLQNLSLRTALFGVLAIGVAFVIITGGIDLSIGSVVGLVGVMLPFLLVRQGWSVPAAVATVLGMSVCIGVAHGLLITKLRLQPFVVTLCGLLLYRGLARGMTNDQSQGFQLGYKSLRTLSTGQIPMPFTDYHLPAPMLIFLGVAALAALLLNLTIYGRYLMALGRNEQAARYSGIHTQRMTMLAYVICSSLAGLGGMLFVLDVNAAQPSDFGNFYELYAIAAAVLGGCSLRGGEGTILGVMIGSTIILTISNAIILVHPQFQNIEFAIIGTVILGGVVVDELVKRYAAKRRAIKQAHSP